ncbi:hypothetical protein [Rubripirellula obstinata]|uniref:hypothetical protein n=1 Tax=Rubripirellula obstinata TaxID=406547 RepID=UPI00082A7CD6|nr:hypothetical protein [Rubripirellula obstinata]
MKQTQSQKDCDERLVFDGEILADDYRVLMPSDLLLWLYWILIPLLAVVLIGVISAIMFVSTKGRGGPASLIAIFGVVAFLGGLLAVSVYNTRSKVRASRRLRSHPDLLGPARGKFTHKGLDFFDGEKRYWFGPAHLTKTRCLKRGIRVRVDADPVRYLAFTDRLVSGYSKQTAERLRDSWQEQAKDPSDTAGLDLWQKISSPPENAVSYEGHVTIQQSLKTKPMRKKLWTEASFVLLNIAGAALFHVLQLPSVLIWVCVGSVCLTLSANLFNWWLYFRGTQTQSWYQQGWVSATEFASRNTLNGVRFALDRFASAEVNDETIRMITPSGIAYYIPREQVVDEQAWTTLKEYFQGPEKKSGLNISNSD